MFICLCHCNARLSDDVELVKGLMQTKVYFMDECLDLLETEPKPDEDEPVPRADEDMRKGKASGKGKPLRVPQLGDENGPKWIEEGWVSGWKLWIGDFGWCMQNGRWSLLRGASRRICPEQQDEVRHGLCHRHLP